MAHPPDFYLAWVNVCVSGGNKEAIAKNRYTAPNVDVGLYAPQGVDLGGGGSSS